MKRLAGAIRVLADATEIKAGAIKLPVGAIVVSAHAIKAVAGAIAIRCSAKVIIAKSGKIVEDGAPPSLRSI